jgi:vacuolar-type H+-ATPase subunit C/Vma6
MDKSGAGAFTFAKASGNLGKSFIGSRTHLLFEQKSLSELWALLFKTQLPLVPEVMLAEQIEKQAFSEFFANYVGYVNMYDRPGQILKEKLCVYEAENLKVIFAALCNHETELPSLIDLGPFSTCHYECWPNLEKITAGTQFAWFKELPSIHEQEKFEYRLDLQIVHHLWDSIQKTSGENRQGLERLFLAEYVIKNIVWALRLRIYYKMEKEEILNHLIYVGDSARVEDPVAGPAIKILDYPLDEADAWSKWQYKDYLNPYVPGEVWKVDPTWIEKVSKAKLNQVAMSVFHQYPMTDCSILAWFKIKEYELTCIRTAVESLRLNINTEEAMKAINLSSDGGVNG